MPARCATCPARGEIYLLLGQLVIVITQILGLGCADPCWTSLPVGERYARKIKSTTFAPFYFGVSGGVCLSQ
jgi:hypothetical protein